MMTLSQKLSIGIWGIYNAVWCWKSKSREFSVGLDFSYNKAKNRKPEKDHF